MDKLKELWAKIKEKAQALWTNIKKTYSEIKWLKWASLGLAVVLIAAIVACSFTMCGGDNGAGKVNSSSSFSDSSIGSTEEDSSSGEENGVVSDIEIPKEDKVTASTHGFTYELFEVFPGVEGYRLTSIGDYSAPKLVVPSTVDGGSGMKPVYAIADDAVSGCDTLKVVELPDTIMKIGERAFENCANLYYVQVGQTCYEIGASAFSGCDNLQAVVLSYASDWQISGNGSIIDLDNSDTKDATNVANLLKGGYCEYTWIHQ